LRGKQGEGGYDISSKQLSCSTHEIANLLADS